MNFATIIIALIAAAVIILALISVIKDRKNGGCSCGCGCKDCPSAGMCHKQSDK